MTLRFVFATLALATLSACDVPQTSQQAAVLGSGPATTQATEDDFTLAAAAQILAYEIDRMPDGSRNSRVALVGAQANGAGLIVDVSHPFTSLPPGFNIQVLGEVHRRLMCNVDIMHSFVELGGVVQLNLQYSTGRTFYTQQVASC